MLPTLTSPPSRRHFALYYDENWLAWCGAAATFTDAVRASASVVDDRGRSAFDAFAARLKVSGETATFNAFADRLKAQRQAATFEDFAASLWHKEISEEVALSILANPGAAPSPIPLPEELPDGDEPADDSDLAAWHHKSGGYLEYGGRILRIGGDDFKVTVPTQVVEAAMAMAADTKSLMAIGWQDGARCVLRPAHDPEVAHLTAAFLMSAEGFDRFVDLAYGYVTDDFQQLGLPAIVLGRALEFAREERQTYAVYRDEYLGWTTAPLSQFPNDLRESFTIDDFLINSAGDFERFIVDQAFELVP